MNAAIGASGGASTAPFVLTLNADARPALAVLASKYKVGLIGDTGYSSGDEDNLLRVRHSANAAPAWSMW